MIVAGEGDAVSGINRYIVGCKLFSRTRGRVNDPRINRYIVGCKSLLP